MQMILIGAGNLATRLALALADKGHVFLQVYSRSESSAQMLADALGCQAVVQPEQIQPNAELYICALKDDALPLILPRLNFGTGLVVHTAGSLPMDILSGYSPNHGVFYPLQTFSKSRSVDFSVIPIFIEAALPESLVLLQTLALDLSQTVVPASSMQRKHLHLAAVFANNFVNYLYSISADLVNEQGLDFSYLLPLIEETAGKVKTMSPHQAQTGPAVRFDRAVIDKHLSALKDHPDWQILYEALSKGIFNSKK